MRRVGIRTANALLFVLGCLLLASILNQWTASALTVAADAPPAVAQAKAPPRPTWAQRNAILERNLFGSATEEIPVEEEVVVVEEVVEETALPVVLLGTAATLDPQYSRAAVSNKSGTDIEVLRVGDTLKNFPMVKVDLIERRRIILLNRSKKEELILNDKHLETNASAPSPTIPTAYTRRQRSTRPVTNARPTVTSKKRPAANQDELLEKLESLVEQTQSNPEVSGVQTLFEDVEVEPEYEKNQLVGLVLSRVAKGSRLEQLGLKSGDRISAINGISITDPVALQKASASMSTADEIRATVNGQPLVITAESIAGLQEP